MYISDVTYCGSVVGSSRCLEQPTSRVLSKLCPVDVVLNSKEGYTKYLFDLDFSYFIQLIDLKKTFIVLQLF